MPQENVETVRLILAAWAEGDFRKEAERLDPEIVFETFMPDAEGNVVARGVKDLAAYTRDWFAQWRWYRIVGEDFEAVGPDKVFASVRQIAAGGQSGVEVESPGFAVRSAISSNTRRVPRGLFASRRWCFRSSRQAGTLPARAARPSRRRHSSSSGIPPPG